MKTISVITLLIGATMVFGQTPERKISSQVKEVTVFIKGAQVTRTATVEIKPGQSIIVLNGISPKVQENSIQAEANQNIRMLGVSFRVNYLKDLKQPDEAANLQKEKARLTNLIHEETTAINVYNEEEAMLKANKVIGGTRGAEIEQLRTAVEYYRQRLMDIRNHQLEIDSRIKVYQKEVARITAMQAEVKSVQPQPEGEIVIRVESKADIRTLLKVSYLVHEASWFPLYDIRAKDIKSPIGITYKASITQQSGEDWENVRLTVSSANPSAAGSRPNMKPWYLGFNNRLNSTGNASVQGKVAGVNIARNIVRGRVFDSDGNPMPGTTIIIKGTSVGTVSDATGAYSIPLSSDATTLQASFIGYEGQEIDINGQEEVNIMLNPDVTQLAEVVVTGYGVQQERHMTGAISTLSGRSREPRVKQTIAATPVVRSINLEFTIDNPYTIRSQGENQVVDMIEYEVDAQYQYYCAPKLDIDAFLTARLTNWDDYNFLEGQASLFFEGKYIGKTILDTRNTSDTLTLSLGRDKNVVVTREKVKEYSSSQFVGSNRKALFAYEINVRNKKADIIDIRIEDQLPVPNTKEITVDQIDDTDAIKNEENGLLTWNLKVEPGETQKIDLKYEIKYPRYHDIILE